MRTIIIEDEKASAQRLKNMLSEISPHIEVLEFIETVEEGLEWAKKRVKVDLIIADIQLTDGLSFDIIEALENPYVIFTTAFNEYAIKAFEINAIDYLLKPIEEKRLKESYERFLNQRDKNKEGLGENLKKLLDNFHKEQPHYKTRFLVKRGNTFQTITTQEVALFHIEDQLTFLTTTDNKKHLLEYSLNDIEQMVHPDHFFRINRQMIVAIDSIKTIHPYFNNRLALETNPSIKMDLIVSRSKVTPFKEWLESH